MSSDFRITQRTISDSTGRHLQANLARLQALQERLSSGRAIQRPSDSPSGTVAALRLRSDVRRADQLGRNAQDGLGRLGAADSALTDAVGLVRQARDLLLRGVNGALSAPEREALALEVEGVRDGLLASANATYLDAPIFGGTSGSPVAYDAAGVYQGDGGVLSRPVAAGVSVPVSLTGEEAFGPPGADVFAVLSDIADHLRSGSPLLTSSDLGRLDEGFLRMRHALATVGSRYHQVEMMQQRTEIDRLAATEQLSDVEGVDLPGTIMELQLQEVAYQAALGATARVIQPSLVDFLR